MIDLNLEKGAIFSDCKKYRFVLWRCWDSRLPKVLFVGLNPSSANETEDDATTRKVISLAKRNGFGGVVLGNCFPFIATNPKSLDNFSFLELNDRWLKSLRPAIAQVVFAWGNFSMVYFKNRDAHLEKIFPRARVLSINKNGTPKHPLYAKFDLITKYYKSSKTKTYDKIDA